MPDSPESTGPSVQLPAQPTSVEAGAASRSRPALTRRSVLASGAAGAAGLAIGLDGTPAAAAPAGNASTGRQPRPGDFVSVRHGAFSLGGRPFRFGGTNCYYLHQQSHYMIDSMLNDAAAMSIPVVRAWAFADGSGHGYTPLQSAPYVYEEAAFDSLDYSIYKAGQLGIKLVLALTNNWADYGGMQQYVQWFLNLPDDTTGTAVNHDLFYSTPEIIKCYKAYARHVTQRFNRYTGLRYNEDPTIMTFELANEPRSRGEKTGTRILGWITALSAHLKQLAPRQLVAIGDEGFYGDPANPDYPYGNFEGNRWKDFIAIPTVDYATVHLYPQGWGENPSSQPGVDPVAWGTKWITDHLRDGALARKPVVLEEYGLAIDAARGVPDTAARDAGYQAWTDAVLHGGGAGDQFWLLTSRIDDGSFYPNYDGYRIIWDNEPGNDSNSTAHLLAAHAKAMAASTTTP